MNLFNILKTRDLHLQGAKSIALPYDVPPIFNIFLKNFDFSRDIYFAEYFIDNTSKLDGFNLFYLEYERVKLQILNFYNENDLLDDFDSYLKDEEIYHNLKLVRFGIHEFGGGLFVGCDPLKNFDQIYIYFWDGQELIKCANNIFEFIALINSEINQYQINESIGNTHNLYKNWNEDFWRIKPPDFRDARPYELLDKDSLDKRYIELKKSGADLSELESEYKVRGLDLPKKFLFW